MERGGHQEAMRSISAERAADPTARLRSPIDADPQTFDAITRSAKVPVLLSRRARDLPKRRRFPFAPEEAPGSLPGLW
jgi:hypothetical protein